MIHHGMVHNDTILNVWSDIRCSISHILFLPTIFSIVCKILLIFQTVFAPFQYLNTFEWFVTDDHRAGGHERGIFPSGDGARSLRELPATVGLQLAENALRRRSGGENQNFLANLACTTLWLTKDEVL